MNQSDERQRVKARIKALSLKTISNGCTEAEAMAAAAMVGKLLERYALSMEEIDIRQEACVTRAVTLRGRQRRPVDGCIPAIARFCDCRVWLHRDATSARYVFFGFEADTEMSAYLFELIERAIATELSLYRQREQHLAGQALRHASRAFQHGMTLRLAERLDEARLEREQHLAGLRETGQALMIVKQSQVDDAFAAMNLRLRRTARRLPGQGDPAFRHGRVSADRVNLNRPVNERRRGLLS
ncbi:Protein of unknown function [Arboricoccus pini]|uniref:Uncharacterized protein n=1 Tax=Arboricoccus pini TaxID=1963835 RepID=A0A212RR47_9PROT|nr:DUF2786 domain-containing protein [Arboricoccus pini]SNB74891.1 Protein of unknown function [Arboricoccus pini]